MADTGDQYPVTTLHRFLDEASNEFKRFRLETKLTLLGSLVLFILIARFVFLISLAYWPWPLNISLQGFFILDSVLLTAALASIITSVYVMFRQRNFISHWGERFEKLQTIENKLLPSESDGSD
jgi:cobalamin biosynthesis protein CobD/CbiB